MRDNCCVIVLVPPALSLPTTERNATAASRSGLTPGCE